MRRMTHCILIAVVIGWPSCATALDDDASIMPSENVSGLFAGEHVSLGYTIKARRSRQRVRLAWTYRIEHRTLASGERTIDLAGAEPTHSSIQLQLPPVRDGVVTSTELVVQAIDPNDQVMARHNRTLWLFPRDIVSGRQVWLESLDIVLYDPIGKSAEVFEQAGIPFRVARSLSVFEQVTDGVAVVGEGTSLFEERNLAAVMIRLAASGVPVLCLAPNSGQLEFAGSLSNTPPARSILFARGNVISQLDKRLDTSICDLPPEQIAVGIAVTSSRGQVHLSLTDSPDDWPWFDMDYAGDGRFLLCGFRIIACWNAGPTPRYLLLRVLEELDNQHREG